MTPDQLFFHQQAVALCTGDPLTPGVNIRQFTLHTSSSILAFLVKELPDSFLVVLPSYLRATPAGEITTHLVTTPALCRFMKSSVLMTTMAEGLPLMYYLDFVEKHISKCPGYFDESRISKIDGVLKALRKELNLDLLKDITKALTRIEPDSEGSPLRDPEEEEIEAMLQRATPLSSRKRH